MKLARRFRTWRCGFASACMPLTAGGAPTDVADPIPDPGRSVVTNDDASSIAVNPGNLAFIRAPELR